MTTSLCLCCFSIPHAGLNADPPPEEDLGEAIFGESILEDEEVDEETVRKWFNEVRWLMEH